MSNDLSDLVSQLASLVASSNQIEALSLVCEWSEQTMKFAYLIHSTPDRPIADHGMERLLKKEITTLFPDLKTELFMLMSAQAKVGTIKHIIMTTLHRASEIATSDQTNLVIN